MKREILLEARNLKKSFRFGNAGNEKISTAVNDVSFIIKEGECLGLVGPSGCGKSTIARMIAGLLSPDSGKILLAGQEMDRWTSETLKELYQNVQMIFQSPGNSFDPRKTLGWSIGESMRNRGWERNRIINRICFLLQEVGLNETYISRYPHEVSGGEVQRAAIARALALSPRLLICDEVTSALDVTIQAQIIRLLKHLIEEQGIGCLFITHDLALLPMIAHKVLVMEKGRAVEEGSPQKLIDSPESPYTKALMEADLFSMTF